MQTDTSRGYCETGGEADAAWHSVLSREIKDADKAEFVGVRTRRVAALLRSFSCFSIQNITSGLWVIAYPVESVAVCAAPPELDREGRRPNGRLRGLRTEETPNGWPVC